MHVLIIITVQPITSMCWQRMQIRELMAPKTAIAIGEQMTEFVETAAEYSNIKIP